MGLGFRVGRGVRVYGGSRGLGVSFGAGPVRYYTRLGGGRRGSARASVAAYQRQVRQAQRQEEIQAVLDLDSQLLALCQAHWEDFEEARQQTAPTPPPVDPREVRKRLEAEATAGISTFKFAERRAAKRQALERLDQEVRTAEERRKNDTRQLQAQLDDQWHRLQANDPPTVLAALESAFADNEAPAAPVSCRGERVDIVVRWSAIDEVVPERKAALTPSGQPTIRKRSKTEQAEFYLEALSSHLLATAKEAFAIAPAINEVGLAAVRAGRDVARGDDILETLLLGTIRRNQVEGIRWANVVSTAALLETVTGRVGLRGKGANKSLFNLDLSEDSEERAFVSELANGLQTRVPEGGIAGLALPVHVVVGS